MNIVKTMSAERKIGNVKWFNNKAGFGFITMGENTDSPKDVFAHYSNINVKNSQYKYLVQGEYVEFELTPTPDSEHEFQATGITGIQGGATLCERRRMLREASAAEIDGEVTVRRPRPSGPSTGGDSNARVVRRPAPRRPREDGPSVSQGEDDDGFCTVKKRTPKA